LEMGNRIVEEAVQARLDSDKQEVIDITCADFDGVSFHVHTNPDAKNLLTISCNVKCWHKLAKNHDGVNQLKKVYGSLVLAQPEGGYDFSLQIDLNKKPADKDIAKKVGLLKREMLATVFQDVFEKIDKKGKQDELIDVPYRSDEAFYIKVTPENVTVIFSISFKDKGDITFSKVFLQEFVDARRNIRGAPACTMTVRELPQELSEAPSNVQIIGGETNGFVSFALFPEHYIPKRRAETINSMLMFRDYLHYHIKCSKAYLHERMRNRVTSLLQVMNRAKIPPPENAEKKVKTFTGKSFTRK